MLRGLVPARSLEPAGKPKFWTMKRTPLYGAHQRLGGKLIEFGGWEMPVQYTSITEEHQAVRSAAGLFDISHMGEILAAARQPAHS